MALSKNNTQECLRKEKPGRERFALRKLSVGVVSILVGVAIYSTGETSFAATPANEAEKSSVVVQNGSAATSKQANTAAAGSQGSSQAANIQTAPQAASNQSSGVTNSDLNKIITRTITVTDPQGKVTTVPQEVKLTRTASVDGATGKVTYSAWTTGNFDQYDVPAITGYTPSSTKVDRLHVDSNTSDSNVSITYAANPTVAEVIFIDDDRNGQQVDSEYKYGKFGESFQVEIPDNYRLTDSTTPTEYTYNVPSSYFTPQLVRIHLKHQLEHRLVENDVYYQQVREINFGSDKEPVMVGSLTKHEYDNGEGVRYWPITNGTLLGKMTGHVSYDLVTHEIVSYDDDWTILKTAGQVFKLTDPGELANGVLTGSSDTDGRGVAEWVGQAGTDSDYQKYPIRLYASTAETKQINTALPLPFPMPSFIQFVTNSDFQPARERNDQEITGFKFADLSANDIKDYGPYSLDDDNGVLKAKTYLPVMVGYYPYVEKTISRTITVVKPDGSKQQIIQQAALDKRVNITYNAPEEEWSTASFAEYNAPEIPGYKPSRNAPAVTVTAKSEFSPILITYLPDPTAQGEGPATTEPTTPSTGSQKSNPQGVRVSAATPGMAKLADTGKTAPVAAQLPQTGNNQESLAAVGLALFGLTSGWLGLSRKRRKQD